jgi:hypothetical protein
MASLLLILHDTSGKIIGVGEVPTRKLKGLYARFVPGTGQAVLEVEKKGELSGKKLPELHRDFRVDVNAKKLVKL